MRLIIVCAAVLLAAYVSQLVLLGLWHTFAIEGRSFRSSALLSVLGCVPFVWPFLVGGFLLARYSTLTKGALWLLVVGILGGFLYSRMTYLLIQQSDSVFNYPAFYLRFVYPIVFSATGFMVGRLFRRNEVA